MSGCNIPKLGAARIKVACVSCIALHLQALLLPVFCFSFLSLSNMTLKGSLANLAFVILGNRSLHTFSFITTQLLFVVLFAFCCASSKGHWFILTHRINSLGVLSGPSLRCQDISHKPGSVEKPALWGSQVSEALDISWTEQGVISWHHQLRD